jgi:hypothetical protein
MQRLKELDALHSLSSPAIVLYHLWFSPTELLGAAVDLFSAHFSCTEAE